MLARRFAPAPIRHLLAAGLMLAAAPAGAVTVQLTLTPTEDVLAGVWVAEVTENLTTGPVTFTTYYIADAETGATFPSGTATSVDFSLAPFTTAIVDWIFLGLYDDGVERGVGVSMPAAVAQDAIAMGTSFEGLLPLPPFGEGTWITFLEAIAGGGFESGLADLPNQLHAAHRGTVGIPSSPFTAPLVNFSTASEGGSLTVTVVPEPARGVLGVLLAVLAFTIRTRARSRA